MMNRMEWSGSVPFFTENFLRIDRDPLLLYNTVFLDETTFTLKGEVNRQNCIYWSDTNPDWMLESHTQYPQKICLGRYLE